MKRSFITGLLLIFLVTDILATNQFHITINDVSGPTPIRLETITFFYDTNTYPSRVVDLPIDEIALTHPELIRPPMIGASIALRVFEGPSLVRELQGIIAPSNRVECTKGLEFEVGTNVVIGLFRELRKADRILQTPQTDE